MREYKREGRKKGGEKGKGKREEKGKEERGRWGVEQARLISSVRLWEWGLIDMLEAESSLHPSVPTQ